MTPGAPDFKARNEGEPPDIAVSSLDALVTRAGALCRDGRRAILGLVGAPGAGKSTVAQQLVERLQGLAVTVPMDGFHLADVELGRLGRRERKGAEDTFDSAGYVALLQRLRAQPGDEIVYAPEFRREIEEPIAGAIPVLPGHRLVVTEGNYLLLARGHWNNVRALLDEIWYLEIDCEVRTQRLIARHVLFGRAPAAAVDWVAGSDTLNAVLIESTRSRADLIVRLPLPSNSPTSR